MPAIRLIAFLCLSVAFLSAFAFFLPLASFADRCHDPAPNAGDDRQNDPRTADHEATPAQCRDRQRLHVPPFQCSKDEGEEQCQAAESGTDLPAALLAGDGKVADIENDPCGDEAAARVFQQCIQKLQHGYTRFRQINECRP